MEAKGSKLFCDAFMRDRMKAPQFQQPGKAQVEFCAVIPMAREIVPWYSTSEDNG
jgi:hypothetical protein